MKKLACLLLALALCACAACASADAFELRNGIRFGMTAGEIIEKEGRAPDYDTTPEFISYRGVEAEGYPDSIVEYHFDENGKLNYVYMSLHEGQKASVLEKDYKAVTKAFTGLYGKPLGNKNGKTDELAGSALKSAFARQSMAKASKATFTLKYNEWKVEADEGIVKVEQIYTAQKSKIANTQDHVVCYTLFPAQ